MVKIASSVPPWFGIALLLFAALMLYWTPRVATWYADYQERLIERCGMEVNSSSIRLFSIVWLLMLIFALVSVAVHVLRWPWFF